MCGPVPLPKGPNMVLERPLMLKIRTANAEPEAAAVLLMCAPVAADCKWFGTLSACMGLLGGVFAAEVSLESAEVFEGAGTGVGDVILAIGEAAEAGEPKGGRGWLGATQGVWSLAVLGAVAPHVHLWMLAFGFAWISS
ncbi:hypothetical protein AMTR_s00114p00100760 [Amborella trichopoda]|uniref:Uncharacterized protein n=1 Tax=Amborella trichopoda TaxID=13333 RepID=W1NTR9_AMBTC|nr:hypothetical protein AMTR_s00114p00100760 [Amborella trichopoda]